MFETCAVAKANIKIRVSTQRAKICTPLLHCTLSIIEEGRLGRAGNALGSSGRAGEGTAGRGCLGAAWDSR